MGSTWEYRSESKSRMTLETPLRGRFLRERYLVFAPPPRYLVLVVGCVLAGLLMIVFGLATGGYWVFVGAMVTVAGVWGALSLNWIAFDLREKTYARRDSAGSVTRYARGALAELEAIFVLAESRASVGQVVTWDRAVTYRLVLQWHALRLPSLILEQDYRAIPGKAPLSYGAGTALALGEKYAKALGVALVNHSHVSVSNPVPVR
jgi:hypothetical protein